MRIYRRRPNCGRTERRLARVVSKAPQLRPSNPKVDLVRGIDVEFERT